MRFTARLRLPLAIAAIVPVTACAAAHSVAPSPAIGAVTIANSAYEDVIVYAIPCGSPVCPIRMGVVHGKATERLRLAKGYFGGGRTLYLYVTSPLGHFAYGLPPAMPTEDQSVYVTVGERSSQVVVR